MNAACVARPLALAGLLLCAAYPGAAAAQYGLRIADFHVGAHMDDSTGWDRDYAVTFARGEPREGALFFSCGDARGRLVAGFRLRDAGAEGTARRVAWRLDGAAPDTATLRGTGTRVWLVDDARVDAFVERAMSAERISMSVPRDSAGAGKEYRYALAGADSALPSLECDEEPESPGVPSGRAALLHLSTMPYLRPDKQLGDDPAPPGWLPRVANLTEVVRFMERNYPPDLRDDGVTGIVYVRVRILADGRAEAATARILEAPHQDFGAVALKALQIMRFQPAVRHGQETSVWVTIPVDFRLPV